MQFISAGIVTGTEYRFKILFMEWLTDSVAFWLRIKTPTMRFGKRKKEKDK